MTGIVLTSWKLSVISPIYEGGARSSAANYRPISLLTVMPKVLDSILDDQIGLHIEVGCYLHPV